MTQQDVNSSESSLAEEASPATAAERRGHGAWWAALSLLVLGILVLAGYLLLREPETVIEWRDTPPDPAQVAELDRLTQRSQQLDAVREQWEATVGIGQCSALDGLTPLDLAAIDRERADIARRRAALGGSSNTEDSLSSPVSAGSTVGGGVGSAVSQSGDPVITQQRAVQGKTDDNSADTRANTVAANASAANAKAANGAALALNNKQLLQRLDDTTVLILSVGSGGKGGTGTGFFVAPQTVITNHHVVENAKNGAVYVTSRALGQVHQASVTALSGTSKFGSADFAALHVGLAPGHSTLAISDAYARLDRVVAAGFPGLSIKNDRGFRALVAGDVTASPELEVEPGDIQAVQEHTGGGEVIRSSTGILQGNSGGPLVDGCGRVVGVNTFVAVEETQAARLSYALSAKMLKSFLDRQRIPHRMETSACLAQ